MAYTSVNKFSVVISFLFVIFSTIPSFCLCKCPEQESEALLSFKANLNEMGDWVNSSWMKGTDCCMWEGITCDSHNYHVMEIYFTSKVFKGGMISDSLCSLPFLTSLTMNDNALTGTLPSCLGNLSHIQYLDLGINNLRGEIPSWFTNTSSLTALMLQGNNFEGPAIPPVFCQLTSLTYIDLRSNQLNGSIPSCLGNLSSLSSLTLDGNQLTGSIPSSLGSLSSLTYLSLSNNQLVGNIPYSLGNISTLVELDVSNNQLNGTIPLSFARLSSLTDLYAYGNAFNQTIPSSAFPSSLESLSLSLNHHQKISETFFNNLTKLLHLSMSNCAVNISTTWIPTFQLKVLYLTFCKIDGPFPPWISTQVSLEYLILTENNLVGELPSWLWETSSSLLCVNLSGNHLQGQLIFPYFPIRDQWLFTLDLSRNELSGNIPAVWPPSSSGLIALMLNDNLLTGSIPPSMGILTRLMLLNLANNNLNGIIPPSLANCYSLQVLNLRNNSLEGQIPNQFSKLVELQSLIIQKNKLKGPFPHPITKYKRLKILDIGHNLFKGRIPKSIANLSELRVLVLTDNAFRGSIPSEIGQLKYLQILDISSNLLSGSIPNNILSLQAMATAMQNGVILDLKWRYFIDYGKATYGITEDWIISMYHDELDMISKGIDLVYPYILSTLTSIDLSHNQLSGGVPSDFGKLKGLKFLNLSLNNLSGVVPNSLEEMSDLESLDLSTNMFSGKIPWGIGNLDYLGFLNLSNNNLSGSIPQGRHMVTFQESAYLGNPYLWGCPLPKNCSWPQFNSPPNSTNNGKKYKEGNRNEIPWYEIAVGLSYGVGFAAVVTLIVARMRWKTKYFQGVDTILKTLFPWLRNQRL